jgi:phosphoserine phosphatase
MKLLFLDMEGTIFAKQKVQLRAGEPAYHNSLWSRLGHELGPRAQEEDARTIVKWEAGEYASYMDWCDETLRIYRSHGLTRDFFERVLASISYNPGVESTCHTLHERGIKTAIVSGGFLEQARRAQLDLKITHAYAAADLLWGPDGQLLHWNILPSDYEGKVDFVRLMMREYGLRREECGFVGDGKNDVFIAQEVGTSFALQGHPELRVVANHAIEEFSEILSWLDSSSRATP